MIRLVHGNLLEAEVDALVNAVNCVGVMGKGLALQFKKSFPATFRAYEHACASNEVRPGKMFIVPQGGDSRPHFIINFPTKRHFRDRSRLEDIESGLVDLLAQVRRLKVKSVAVPALGCGLGGLDWRVVRPRIESALGELSEVDVLLYEPTAS